MTKRKTKKTAKAKKALAKAKSRSAALPKPATPDQNSEGRLNLRITPGLKTWARDYAARHGTTVTQIVADYFTELRAADEDRLAADAEQL
jgi:hypothetical protein